MRIFDIPATPGVYGAPRRILVHGTCRVHDPFESLAASGRARKVWASNQVVSYSLANAVQATEWYLGLRPVDAQWLDLMVDDPSKFLAPEPAHRSLLQSVDVCVFEVSDLNQISLGSASLQTQVFTKNFISRYGGAILPWYRLFAAGSAVPEEVIEAVRARLRVPSEEWEHVRTVLREARHEGVDVPDARRSMQRLATLIRADWLFLPHIVVPNVTGTLMDGRRRLREVVREAANGAKVGFFDPGGVVRQFGRELALAKQGADLNHYEPAFCPRVATAVLDKLEASAASPVAVAQPEVALAASSVNAMLVCLHRERVSRSGVDASGLHQHYAARLENREIVTKRDLSVADMLIRFLPRFAEYHVLRAGLGELAFLLAALGQSVVAAEPFDSRVAALTAAHDWLADLRFPGMERVVCLKAVVPVRDVSKKTIAVAHQLTMTMSAEQEEAALAALEQYDAVLFDPRSLITTSADPRYFTSVRQRLRRAGFRYFRDLSDLGLVFYAKQEPTRSRHRTSRADGT